MLGRLNGNTEEDEEMLCKSLKKFQSNFKVACSYNFEEKKPFFQRALDLCVESAEQELSVQIIRYSRQTAMGLILSKDNINRMISLKQYDVLTACI